MATTTADRDADEPTCYCRGGVFAAEHGEDVAAEFRMALNA